MLRMSGCGTRAVLRSMLAAAVIGAVGCGAIACRSEPTLVRPAEFTATPCAILPESLVADLHLSQRDESHDVDRLSARASCSMTGLIQEEPVTISVTLTSPTFRSRDEDARPEEQRQATEDLAESECSDLERWSTDFEKAGSGCVGSLAPRDSGSATAVDLLPPGAEGVVKVVIAYEGPQWDRIREPASEQAAKVAERYAMAPAAELKP